MHIFTTLLFSFFFHLPSIICVFSLSFGLVLTFSCVTTVHVHLTFQTHNHATTSTTRCAPDVSTPLTQSIEKHPFASPTPSNSFHVSFAN
jgi:hypothetical protein